MMVGSVDEGACHQAWPEVGLQDPYDRLSPKSSDRYMCGTYAVTHSN